MATTENQHTGRDFLIEAAVAYAGTKATRYFAGRIMDQTWRFNMRWGINPKITVTLLKTMLVATQVWFFTLLVQADAGTTGGAFMVVILMLIANFVAFFIAGMAWGLLEQGFESIFKLWAQSTGRQRRDLRPVSFAEAQQAEAHWRQQLAMLPEGTMEWEQASREWSGWHQAAGTLYNGGEFALTICPPRPNQGVDNLFFVVFVATTVLGAIAGGHGWDLHALWMHIYHL